MTANFHVNRSRASALSTFTFRQGTQISKSVERQPHLPSKEARCHQQRTIPHRSTAKLQQVFLDFLGEDLPRIQAGYTYP